jgi:hypothetical protein
MVDIVNCGIVAPRLIFSRLFTHEQVLSEVRKHKVHENLGDNALAPCVDPPAMPVLRLQTNRYCDQAIGSLESAQQATGACAGVLWGEVDEATTPHRHYYSMTRQSAVWRTLNNTRGACAGVMWGEVDEAMIPQRLRFLVYMV